MSQAAAFDGNFRRLGYRILHDSELGYNCAGHVKQVGRAGLLRKACLIDAAGLVLPHFLQSQRPSQKQFCFMSRHRLQRCNCAKGISLDARVKDVMLPYNSANMRRTTRPGKPLENRTPNPANPCATCERLRGGRLLQPGGRAAEAGCPGRKAPASPRLSGGKLLSCKARLGSASAALEEQFGRTTQRSWQEMWC